MSIPGINDRPLGELISLTYVMLKYSRTALTLFNCIPVIDLIEIAISIILRSFSLSLGCMKSLSSLMTALISLRYDRIAGITVPWRYGSIICGCSSKGNVVPACD